MDDDYVSSELYRLMPPRQSSRRSELREALAAAGGGRSEIREALDLAGGPVPAESGAEWTGSLAKRQRQWSAPLSRTFGRVDVWILIATIAGVVIAYLALVKPG